MSSLERENKTLEIELGREHDYPRFQWRFSENLYMPMRDKDNKYDYVADPTSGIIMAKPVYELRKIASHLNRQYVICRWCNPGPEDVWVKEFGKHVEYPRNGYYIPTNVYLDPDVTPWDTDDGGKSLTWHIVGIIREQEKKTYADHLRDGEAIVEYREKEKDRQMEDIIGSVLLPFGHIPGSREGGVSLPSKQSTANHDEAFSE